MAINTKVSSSYQSDVAEFLKGVGVYGDASIYAKVSGAYQPIGNTVGGITIGTEGAVGTVYEGFTFDYGDDFNSMPAVWDGNNLSGRYSSSPPHIGFRRIQADGPDRMIYIEPNYRGGRSQSPTALGFDARTQAASVLTITPQAVPGGLYPYLPTSYSQGGGDGSNKPVLISSGIRSWPSYMFSGNGDWIFEGIIRLPSGVARGFWPSIWGTAINWPDYGEFDLLEGKKDASGNITDSVNVHVSDTDGGPDVGTNLGNLAEPADRDVHYLAIKSGTTITMYDDSAVQGTLAQRATYTNARVGRFRGAWDLRMEFAVNAQWDSSTYTQADWPKSMSIDWFRVWIPNGTPRAAATNVLGYTTTSPGGSWAYSIPSNTVLFGSDVTPDVVEVYAAFDNEDCPGMPTRANRLPGGMSVDMTARTATGTVPTTEGGRVGLLFLGSFSGGGAVRRAIHYFNVAPAVQTLFLDQDVAYAGAVSLTMDYESFHSGNLGPHTYNVTKSGGSWLTITGNGTASISITGTAPSADETVTLTIDCTNSIGQVSTVIRTITVQATVAFDPVAWTDAIEVFDSSDNTKVFSDAAATIQAVAGSDVGAALVGKKAGIVLSNSTAGTQPDYVTDANGLGCLNFDYASVDRLVTTSSAIINNVTGNDNAYAIIGRFKRGTPGQSSTPCAFFRNDAGTVLDFIRHFFGGTNNPGITRTAAGTATTASGTGSVLSADQWYTVGWFFSGTSLTLRVDGVNVGSSIALNTASLTISHFALGAFFQNGTDSWDSLAFGGRIGEITILNSVSSTDPNVSAYEAYLAAKWTN